MILDEGWSFEVGLGLATHHPNELDSSLLTHCGNHLIMRLINPIDQESLKHCGEIVGTNLIEKMLTLSKGQVLVSGTCVENPVLCKLRKSITKVNSQTLKPSQLWTRYFQS